MDFLQIVCRNATIIKSYAMMKTSNRMDRFQERKATAESLLAEFCENTF